MSFQFKKPRRSVRRVFIHCSASDKPRHDSAKVIDRWHKERGWSGIGYHFFIRKNGKLEIGRNIEKIPAAQGGASKKPGSVRGGNRHTIAICLHGLDKDKFTEAQFDTLRNLCWQIHDAYDGKVTFHGHREVAFKECPVFDYKDVLRLDEQGRLGAAGMKHGLLQPIDGGVQDRNFNVTKDLDDIPLTFGMDDPKVAELQNILNAKGYHCGAADGVFGPETRGAVLRMKADNGLDTSTDEITIRQAEACEDREVSTDRAEAGVDHVVAHSETAKMASAAVKANAVKVVAGGASVAGALNVDSPQAALEKAEDIVGKAEQGKNLLDRSQDVVQQYTGGAVDIKTVLLVLAVGITVLALYGLWKSRGALLRRVQDYNTGKNLGH